MPWFTYVIAALALAVAVLIYYVADLSADLNFFRGYGDKWYKLYHELLSKKQMFTVSEQATEHITSLQKENAELRTDLETGFRLIDKQRATNKDLTDRLNRLIAENRRFLGTIRRRK